MRALAAGADMVAEEMLPRVAVVKADPDDDLLLATALSGGASVVVSGDPRHLLSLGEFAGVRVIGPATFLVEIDPLASVTHLEEMATSFKHPPTRCNTRSSRPRPSYRVAARPPRDRVPAVRPPVPPPRDATPVGGQDPHLADFDDQLSRCLDWLSLNRARLQFGNTHHPGHPNQRWSLPLPTVLEPMGPASQPSSRESFPLGVVGRGLPARPPLRHPRRPRLWSHHPAHSAAAPSSSPAGLHAADTDLWHGLRRRAAQRTKAGGGRASARHAVG